MLSTDADHAGLYFLEKCPFGQISSCIIPEKDLCSIIIAYFARHLFCRKSNVCKKY